MASGRFLDDLLLKGLLITIDDCQITDISPCIIDETRKRFLGKISRNLEDVLPILYLATLNSKLTKSPIILSFTLEQHNFMLGEKGDLAVTFVKNEAEMKYILEKITELVNKGIKYKISNKRDLNRLIVEKKKLNSLSLYDLFPKTDCSECGEKSCFNYAAKVFIGESSHDKCPYVDTERVLSAITPVKLGWSIHFG